MFHSSHVYPILACHLLLQWQNILLASVKKKKWVVVAYRFRNNENLFIQCHLMSSRASFKVPFSIMFASLLPPAASDVFVVKDQLFLLIQGQCEGMRMRLSLEVFLLFLKVENLLVLIRTQGMIIVLSQYKVREMCVCQLLLFLMSYHEVLNHILNWVSIEFSF